MKIGKKNRTSYAKKSENSYFWLLKSEHPNIEKNPHPNTNFHIFQAIENLENRTNVAMRPTIERARFQ